MEKNQGMRNSGKYLKEILDLLCLNIKEGNTGKDLEIIMNDFCSRNNVKPAFLGFRGFPSSLCVCINEEIVHGVPDSRPFKQEDMITIDAGIVYEGWITDSARSVVIGDNQEALRLSKATKEALYAGMAKIKNGVQIYEVSKAIESKILEYGYFVLGEFCGHGVGAVLHTDPQIPNETRTNMSEGTLKTGDTVAIEPIVAKKNTKAILGKDGRVYVTANGELSCQWEHTIMVTDDGFEILTG